MLGDLYHTITLLLYLYFSIVLGLVVDISPTMIIVYCTLTETHKIHMNFSCHFFSLLISQLEYKILFYYHFVCFFLYILYFISSYYFISFDSLNVGYKIMSRLFFLFFFPEGKKISTLMEGTLYRIY